MGLEPVWKSHRVVLVSDAGSLMDAEADKSWTWRIRRYQSIQECQARGVRKRFLISGFTQGTIKGAYIGVGSSTARYAAAREPGYSKAFAMDVIANIPHRRRRVQRSGAGGADESRVPLIDAAIRTRAPELIAADVAFAVPFPQFAPPAMTKDELRRGLVGSEKRTLTWRGQDALPGECLCLSGLAAVLPRYPNAGWFSNSLGNKRGETVRRVVTQPDPHLGATIRNPRDTHLFTRSRVMTADVASIAVSLDHLEHICKAGLLARGATEDEATLVYQDYLDAELRGRNSHGLAAFHLALREFPIRGHFEVIDSPEPLLRIRANGACGHVVARRAVDLALTKISSAGVCLVGIQDSTRFNSPGPIARYAVARDLIAVVLYYGGENLMAAPNGIKRALSTNPIGIGIPTMGAMPPFVLDIATSERAMGYITLAKLLGQDIPPSWAADASGSSTTDPHAVSAVKPFAGHKGFGIALAVEILVGPLLGVPIGTRGSLGSRGTLMVLIHPTAFGETYADFLLHTSRFLQEVKASGGGDGTICYPGEAGEARYRQAMKSKSVTLPIAVMDKLVADLR